MDKAAANKETVVALIQSHNYKPKKGVDTIAPVKQSIVCKRAKWLIGV